jgi:hypothetical protein
MHGCTFAPGGSNWWPLLSINVATGLVASREPLIGSLPLLVHPAGNAIYADAMMGPRIDISGGAAGPVPFGGSFLNLASGAILRDGRVPSTEFQVATTSANRADDLKVQGQLQAPGEFLYELFTAASAPTRDTIIVGARAGIPFAGLDGPKAFVISNRTLALQT